MSRFKNKKIAVIGLGIEGKDAVNFLLKEGAGVTVHDKKLKEELDLSDINEKKVDFVCGDDYLSGSLDRYDVIVRSPGVYRYKKKLVEAEKSGVEITSAIKIFFEECPGKIIGVTGTKGKGTTATLIYKTIKKTGKDAYLAGNIGKPFLELLPKLNKKSLVVLELSSFQLIDLDISPHIAVVLNITVDHLDWHKDKNQYVESKKNIVKHQKKSDFAVLNYDYQNSRKFKDDTNSQVYYFSKDKNVKGAFVDNGKLFLDIDDKKEIGSVDNLKLRGKHNWENTTAAICASYLAGADIDSIRDVVFGFEGLEHRLEAAGKVNDISFYNDSFSTNVQTTIAAIKSFNEPLTLIAGGSGKGFNYDELGEQIAKTKNLKTVVLIGQVADQIEGSVKKAGFKGKLLNTKEKNIDKIVDLAQAETPKGGVVLLSPAAASFDMFDNYKDRGKKFKKAVKNLKKIG